MSRFSTAAFLAILLGTPSGAEADGVSAKTERLFEKAKTHWTYQPLAQTAPPAVSAESATIHSDIDRFVVEKLAAAGLSLSPEADKAALIRRVTFDLIGLPPTPEEVAAFLADDSPLAYEKWVDRLLASPHYGERRPPSDPGPSAGRARKG